jgi:hypothetical protein
MGKVCVKDEQSPFSSTGATFSSRPRALQDDARRSSQGRPFRAAAQRLDLELSEHDIMLVRSGTIGAAGVGGSVRASAILAFAVQGSSRFGDLGCLPDQTHIRSSREATAPRFRLRRAGSRGRGHSSLRHLKPCNPSVRPPGSSEADRASADRLWSFRCASGEARRLVRFWIRRASSGLPRWPRPRLHTSTRPREACVPAPRSRACGLAGFAP